MISKNAEVNNCKLGSNVKIYKFAEVNDCEIGENSFIGDLSIVKASQLESNIAINRSNIVLRSRIGRYSYTGNDTTIRSANVGRFCSLATNVNIGGGNHVFDHVTTSPLWRFKMLDQGNTEHDKNSDLTKRYKEFGDCVIGNDVWIATNAVILRGVKVGNGAIIGAGAIVNKDVEPYSVVVGVPAKKIRMRFNGKIIESLQEIKWWDWPVEVIREHQDLIYSTKVDDSTLDKLRDIGNNL